MKEWEQKVRLAEYYYQEDSGVDYSMDKTQDEHDRIKKKRKSSTYMPQPGRNKWLDMFLEVVKQAIVGDLKKKINPNISKAEEKALHDMMNDISIIIRPVDKGSGIVILHAEEYKIKINEELAQGSCS